MLKSLYSGVSGLQAHQIAMDVESNNIANVNTSGFKYSRANFSDLLAQTKAIATAPQGELGGKNPVQVGLGSTVSSTTRIFSQGSVQNSDKNTDVAIQGDGFFIVSPDGGNTYKYTRAGDFKFDAGGNFVDNNGFIVQGWLRDSITGKVDSTAPITNINIPPGLTTPAQPTQNVVIKANLNSGPLVDAFSPAYSVPSGEPNSITNPGQGDAFDANGNSIEADSMGVMFNDSGEAFSLQAGQGIWASFQNSEVVAAGQVGASTYAIGTVTSDDNLTNASIDVTVDGVNIVLNDTATADVHTADENGARYAAAINNALDAAGKSGLAATYDNVTGELYITNTNSTPIAMTVATAGASGLAATPVIGGNQLALTFTLDNGDVKTITTSGGTGRESASQNAVRYVSAINAQTPTTGILATYDTTTGRITLINSNSNELSSHNIRLTAVGGDDNSGFIAATDITAFRYQYDPAGASAAVGADKTFSTIADLRYAMEQEARTTIVVTPTTTTPATVIDSTNGTSNSITVEIDGVSMVIPDNNIALSPAFNSADDNGAYYASYINANSGRTDVVAVYDTASNALIMQNYNTTASLTFEVTATNGDGTVAVSAAETIVAATDDVVLNNIQLSVNEQGKFELKNPGGSAGDYDINLAITGMNSSSILGGGITENTRFTRSMEALNATLQAGSTGTAFSQSFNAATHSASIDIFDSLGSKHTLRTEYRKTAVDASTGSTWSMRVSVPEPAVIDTVLPYNEKDGFVRFNNDGSLATYNPPNISFTANNGSAPNQQVSLELGTANQFDGMTSFDSKSSTSGISQDGFTGGDLVGIRIDQSGTLVGSFSNGRSFGLAQIGMAKFTNNEGLAAEGSNVYVQTANSGDPIIGTAATAGRGFMQASALEASNVDLSLSLTQLIIIQRGYQANGKTITTSDTLLETLIGLKR
ncbi:MAG: flagellar hook-basal body complex protein [Sulfurimonas sp.]|uniref:flagellar hook-basal body complex protein n=1 Tax=Sulfurimonas sp. TaxID=2022749 RepID=UPI0026342C48|nr:flagellar hook-basal body complex protein [Sulfurimonas sp.]MDD2652009.1 flagellar hook-basal body complex protein [Sulfurimonas sp.]MDD3451865.1 flagellar hook-basal body complex protein [Sulfurimonas sp.]